MDLKLHFQEQYPNHTTQPDEETTSLLFQISTKSSICQLYKLCGTSVVGTQYCNHWETIAVTTTMPHSRTLVVLPARAEIKALCPTCFLYPSGLARKRQLQILLVNFGDIYFTHIPHFCTQVSHGEVVCLYINELQGMPGTLVLTL